MGYRTGMNLYAPYFVPNALDPSGNTIKCCGGSGFAGAIIGISGSAMRCSDDCGNSKVLVVCGGGGIGVGGSFGGGGSVGEGCLEYGFSTQFNGQGALDVIGGVGGGGTVGLQDGHPISIGGGGGVGMGGVSGTFEGCYVFLPDPDGSPLTPPDDFAPDVPPYTGPQGTDIRDPPY